RPAYLLSTVRQPFEDMANSATQLLRQSLDEQPIGVHQMMLQGTLIERGSAQLLPDPSNP
ncbi:MAG: hypothetical protein ACKO1L_13995, partial [Brachymonas sp.]